ncbi:gamma-glutamylputrescine oxidase [Tranquillimonas rosea]|uniref:Gamma-glutamylputrescine oxidase n=1 Tax=Tranquillimonas rosea TaxID=641238 RepID=A0A1H9WCS8_9RHOB|nr:FAD-binding oxidoreductase [Tranquillimonas rosea]SES31746.1 gamma-glutamylputrescine oxidase [Tranquillimonas rosea]
MGLLDANGSLGTHADSWYAATATAPEPSAPLRGAHRADVCVIGGGYTGLSAALHMAEAGRDVVLLEAHRVGWGASGRNGGQIGSGQRQDQAWLEARMGRDDARALWRLSEEAKHLLVALIARHRIDAAWRPGLISAERFPSGVAAAHRIAERMARDYGYHRLQPLDRDALRAIVRTDAFAGGLLDHGAGHLHPLRLAFGLARAATAAGVHMFETSRATAVSDDAPHRVETTEGHIIADQVILATNGYHDGLDRRLAPRVMPINNFVAVTEPLGPRATEVLTQDVGVADDRFVVNYWRLTEDRRLLFGGGESYRDRFPADIAGLVRRKMAGIYPQLRDIPLTHAWGGTLGITASRMPHLARLAPTMLTSGGYSGHGVAMACLGGQLAARALQGQSDGFDLMARVPTPGFPGSDALRPALLTLAMTWFGLRDRLGL